MADIIPGLRAAQSRAKVYQAGHNRYVLRNVRGYSAEPFTFEGVEGIQLSEGNIVRPVFFHERRQIHQFFGVTLLPEDELFGRLRSDSGSFAHGIVYALGKEITPHSIITSDYEVLKSCPAPLDEIRKANEMIWSSNRKDELPEELDLKSKVDLAMFRSLLQSETKRLDVYARNLDEIRT